MKERGVFGTQSIQINDYTLPLSFDGHKVYAVLHKPTPADLDGRHPIFELTSSQQYNPAVRLTTRRVNMSAPTLEDWQKNLGYIDERLAKLTLNNTTHLIHSAEAETREYM